MIDTWATVGSCAQIGKNVHLSGGVGVGGVLEPVQASPVIIEDDCFIGYHSIILMGVRVGRGSIVGAGAVVTRDVPTNSVIAGNPAKVICTVDELVQKRVQQIRKNPSIFPAGLEKLKVNK